MFFLNTVLRIRIKGEDARVLLNSVTYTISVSQMKLLFIKLHTTYASCPTHYISQQTQMDDGICFKYFDLKAVAEHSLPGL